MRTLVVVTLALCLLLLAQPAVSQVSDDKLIVPGVRVGKWALDMTISALVEMNGPENVPPSATRSGTPVDLMSRWYPDCREDIWEHWWSNLFFSAATRGRESQRVEYIFTRSGDFKTEKNIALGLTREDVEKAYGKPIAVTRAGSGASSGDRRAIYDDIGLDVVTDRNGIVVRLGVFRPKTAHTLWNF
jgi:hypothetical protein